VVGGWWLRVNLVLALVITLALALDQAEQLKHK
jgi:hypothetical protein